MKKGALILSTCALLSLVSCAPASFDRSFNYENDGSVGAVGFAEEQKTNTKSAEIQSNEYYYDKAVGGDFELPVKFNSSEFAMLKINSLRIPSTKISVSGNLVKVSSEFVLNLSIGDYDCVLITTMGSHNFILKVINTIDTNFDIVRDKNAVFGKDKFIKFDVDFNGSSVKKLTYGDYTITPDYYEVSDDGILIKDSFFGKTYGDGRKYKLTLSNNEYYEFNINTNVKAATDYDVTTMHDELESAYGINKYYQDSTRVSIIDSPSGCPLNGKVLKFVPHQEDVLYDCHGIYTFERTGGSSTWAKIPFIRGKYYNVSFDYVTYETTEGEDFVFRSWNSAVKSPKLDTGHCGELHHFSYTFKWDNSLTGVFLFGKFINGGYILIDNYVMSEFDELPSIDVDANYKGDSDFTFNLDDKGFAIDKITISGKSVNYSFNNGIVTILKEELNDINIGKQELIVSTPVIDIVASFNYSLNVDCELSETSKTFKKGIEELVLSGTMAPDITVISATRSGTDSLEEEREVSISPDYFEIMSSGLKVKKGLLDQIYGTETISVDTSSGTNLQFTLTSNQFFFTNFDETNLWDRFLFCEDTNNSIVKNVDGFNGNVLRVCNIDSTVHVDDWYQRFFAFYVPGYEVWGKMLEIDGYTKVRASFDVKIEKNQCAFNKNYLGFYYITQGHSGEHPIADIEPNYFDGNLHHITIEINVSDLQHFALGLDQRESGSKSVVIYVDNFGLEGI